jgi:thioredoxin reductase (NADPH)
MEQFDVIIIGNGVAGLSAAIYAGRANNTPLVIKGDEPGGQLTLTSEIANYPGVPDNPTGSELIQRMTEQAETFGTSFTNGIVESIQKTEDAEFYVELTNEDTYQSSAVIVASGSSAKTLGVPGEDEYMGYGVSTCATCDGAFFRDQDMVVVGGGDAAFEEAKFLTKFADTVYLIHRREEFRAEEYLQEQIIEDVETGDIEILTNTEVVEIYGEDSEVTGVQLVEHPDGHPTEKPQDEVAKKSLPVNAVFYAIGHTPNTAFLEETGVELDERGYVTVKSGLENATATDVDGIFAAGDVVDHHYQQAATAAGMGVKAAIDVDHFLSK